MIATSDTTRSVPGNLALSSAAYKRRAWIAITGLLLFFIFYVGLASWFTFIAYRLIAGVFLGGDGAFWGFLASLPAAFFAVFMWKALFFVRRNKDRIGVEIKSQDQPELFEFLHQLADQIGAPRVHRVFLTPDVNAGVFYDLSILNFLIPTKKNLAIGLGLVNTLNRSELTAVLAHEFGHFAQRTMAIGRWAHIGEQIAGHIIAKRDALDSMLQFIANIDLRVAWIGWIMQAIVWSIRSVMETTFRWVILAQRALTREMEFQADKVAVSIAGSDSIVHALYRLQPADEDWDQTLEFLGRQLQSQNTVGDPFVVHHRISEHLRSITGDPKRGLSPTATRERVFEERLAQPPRMWLTHPSNIEREDQAKREYMASNEDTREAWSLFRNPVELRRAVGKFMVDRANLKGELTELSESEILKRVDDEYLIPIHDPKYRGAYLGRKITLARSDVSELASVLLPRENIRSALSSLYADDLHEAVMLCRQLDEEVVLLESLEKGFLEAPAGVIRHRGETVEPSQLKAIIDRVKQERADVFQIIDVHDRQCRTAHLSAAFQINGGWLDYLSGLLKLLHYAEHSFADLTDAMGHLWNQVSVNTAAGRVSSRGRNLVVLSANNLQRALKQLDLQAGEVEIPAPVLQELKIENWRAAFNKFELPPATNENLHEWINVIQSWAVPMVVAFQQLQRATLNELLRTEDRVAASFIENSAIDSAPQAAKIPEQYATRVRGTERKRKDKLDWWSRFVVADGKLPSAARFVVTTAIVATIAVTGFFIGGATVVIYNGLATNVKVSINNLAVEVPSMSHRRLAIGTAFKGKVETVTKQGTTIEDFETTLGQGFATYVYNVAGAAPLVQWTAVYGNASASPPRLLGCPTWLSTGANCVFEEPPRQLSTKNGGTWRTVLDAIPSRAPLALMSAVEREEHAKAMILAHARWDGADNREILTWLTLASRLPEWPDIVKQRLTRDPLEIVSLRTQYDKANVDEKKRLEIELHKLAETNPENAELQYLKIRMLPDGPEQDTAFIEAYRKWPESLWLCYTAAASYERTGDWQAAKECFEKLKSTRIPTYDLVAIGLARIRRYEAKDARIDLSDLNDCLPLNQLLALESGQGNSGITREAAFLLHHGQVAEAHALAISAKDQAAQITAALSTGAEPAWVDDVLAIPVTEVGMNFERLYLAAMAAKRGLPFEQYLEISQEDSQSEISQTLLTKLRKWLASGRDAAVDPFDNEDFKGLRAEERGVLIQAWLLYAPEKATVDTVRATQTLLFTLERPYVVYPFISEAAAR